MDVMEYIKFILQTALLNKYMRPERQLNLFDVFLAVSVAGLRNSMDEITFQLNGIRLLYKFIVTFKKAGFAQIVPTGNDYLGKTLYRRIMIHNEAVIRSSSSLEPIFNLRYLLFKSTEFLIVIYFVIICRFGNDVSKR